MADPSIHQHPTTSTADAARLAVPWQPWSRAWTKHIRVLTGRSDLTVLVSPGAGGGAPACFYPDERRIEVDATYIGHPDITDPNRAVHKKLVPTAYGLLVHEAAHCAHSHWRTPPGTPPVITAVADLLEESRAEHQQRLRRRGDRRWLRHTVTTLLDPADAPIDDLWHAAHLAGLLLARADARILTHKDVRPVRGAVTAILGRPRLTQLRQVWREAHTCPDTDADTMIRLARQWCRILDIDPDRQPDTPTADPGAFPGDLAAALTGYLAVQHGLTPGVYTEQRITAGHGVPAGWTRRDPTNEERQAASRLAARLAAAWTSHTDTSRTPAAVPPGRLRARQAVTVDAQRATGAIPTATPWHRRAQLPPDKPALHIAVLVDVSGSMRAYTRPLSSAAWILAHAARRNRAVTTTIAFASRTTLLVAPRRHPDHVHEMAAGGGTTTFTDAVKLADHLLHLRHPKTVRLLVVVSDGDLPDQQPAQRLISTLHQSGCVVLWLRPADMPGYTFGNTTTAMVSDPVQAIDTIADAAVTALEHA